MDNNKPHPYQCTASGAGLPCGIKWTAVKNQEVRTDVLTKHLVRLRKVGLVSWMDELASARRRFQHLVGWRGKDGLRIVNDGGICWRDRASDMEDPDKSIRTL